MSKKTPQVARDVWGLFHIPSQSFVQFGTKCGWSGASGTKRAWQVHTGKVFREQEDFIAVNLSKLYYEKLEKESAK